MCQTDSITGPQHREVIALTLKSRYFYRPVGGKQATARGTGRRVCVCECDRAVTELKLPTKGGHDQQRPSGWVFFFSFSFWQRSNWAGLPPDRAACRGNMAGGGWRAGSSVWLTPVGVAKCEGKLAIDRSLKSFIDLWIFGQTIETSLFIDILWDDFYSPGIGERACTHQHTQTNTHIHTWMHIMHETIHEQTCIDTHTHTHTQQYANLFMQTKHHQNEWLNPSLFSPLSVQSIAFLSPCSAVTLSHDPA